MVSSIPAHLRSASHVMTCCPVLQGAGISKPLWLAVNRDFSWAQNLTTLRLRGGEEKEKWPMFPAQAHHHPNACAPSPHMSLASLITITSVPQLSQTFLMTAIASIQPLCTRKHDL